MPSPSRSSDALAVAGVPIACPVRACPQRPARQRYRGHVAALALSAVPVLGPGRLAVRRGRTPLPRPGEQRRRPAPRPCSPTGESRPRGAAGAGNLHLLPGEPELALAELLCGRVPSFERVRFTPDAHRAATWALRAARAATGRERVAWIGPLPHPDAETAAGDEALLLSDQDPDAALEQVAAHGSSLAAVIIDPVPRSRGFQSPASGRLQQIEEVARHAGAVLVFDERDSFRFGFAGAQGRFAGTPELTILGAHVGGGLPAAAVAGIEQVMETLAAEPGIGPVPVGWSAPTNPAAMAAGHAAFSLLDLAAFDHLDRMGEKVRVRLRELATARNAPIRVGGIGSVFTLRARVGTPEFAIDSSICQIALLDRGVVLARDASGCSPPRPARRNWPSWPTPGTALLEAAFGLRGSGDSRFSAARCAPAPAASRDPHPGSTTSDRCARAAPEW
ncbi:MAG: aminotransferase class III-fold pyridoxal phosphate-dependent enzyme [Gammaproteobacteria bacterium]|nr:aminotransferase class III-fold pyridoxal phosphate-dependent enzyme [Gammaproteobacteria bacterium]